MKLKIEKIGDNMAIYAIADLHLSKGTGKNKSMDIFSGWENYEDRLEKNWRKIVKPDDTVIMAGDFSWGLKLEETKKDFEFLESLPGKKILLKGNHDYWWATRKKIDDFLNENKFNSVSVIFNSAEEVENYSICGTRGWFYDKTCESDEKILKREVQRLETSITLAKETGKEPLVFLHYPPIYSQFKCEEILKTLKKYEIKRCYYGHLHGKNAISKAFIGNYEGIEFDLISADYLNFTPKLIV